MDTWIIQTTLRNGTSNMEDGRSSADDDKAFQKHDAASKVCVQQTAGLVFAAHMNCAHTKLSIFLVSQQDI